ncbi:isochorismate pyruvate lyase [Saccharothrix saharensis]|uniref:Isochorismate pyruvate lyase n=1 Tax=Saccharothrix saharensis TaxID=571190 RepID=A0A543JMH2_9PSEU|nr:chorismate mutase [Saccharothrix saharensis]TQM84052.1 isochorismate pyruvate lyase [Saccharothrix saharensis]
MMIAVTVTPPPTSLAEVRARIDAIDSDLVRLLARRQDLVRAAAAFKSDDQAVRAPDRVARVIASVRERASAEGLDPAVAEAVWRAMIGAFIELELAEHATNRD